MLVITYLWLYNWVLSDLIIMWLSKLGSVPNLPYKEFNNSLDIKYVGNPFWLFTFNLYKSFTSGNLQPKNNWKDISFATSLNEFEKQTPSANTIEFILESPIASHPFDVIPTLTVTNS